MQSYRAQIKSFLDAHKPYFIYEEQVYFIEDIASYHIHAGDYFRKDKPAGGHSNYGGDKLNHFNPLLKKEGLLDTKDMLFHNSRNLALTKNASVYPEGWSELLCDLKVIQAMMNNQVKIIPNDIFTSFNITGYTSDGLEVIIHYDIATKRIKSHYPSLRNYE